MRNVIISKDNMKLIAGIGIGLATALAGVAIWRMFFRMAIISGKVTDKNTGEPIAGVTVTLGGYDGTVYTATTDENGKYVFNKAKTSYLFQGYTYFYYYDLVFTASDYQSMAYTQLAFHPSGNFYDAQMEAL